MEPIGRKESQSAGGRVQQSMGFLVEQGVGPDSQNLSAIPAGDPEAQLHFKPDPSDFRSSSAARCS